MEFDDDDDLVFQDDINDPKLNSLLQDEVASNRSIRNVDADMTLYEEISLDSGIIDKPTHHAIDYGSLGKYIYPTNFEVRDYQYNIVHRAFFDNLLVTLPTGLGKTFIASTVMLNFLSWFPNSKLIFMAPTRPLVAQQIKACCGISGIPSSKVAILLDKTRKNRKEIWDSKSVFFTTPQVVENDLASGIVDPKTIVLLVIDEAHRAKGNYSYNNVVKFLKRFNNSFRILALTATPASNVEGVQEIIDNLDISKVEVRTEKSIDISKYIKRKRIERRNILPSSDIMECVNLISTAISPVLRIANERKIYEMSDPSKINAFQCMDASQRIIKNSTIPEGLKWSNFFILKLLGIVGQCYRRLNIYGLKSFYSYFKEQYNIFSAKWSNKKSTNKLNADFFFSESIKNMMSFCEGLLGDKNYISHPKLETLIDELKSFFEEKEVEDSKVIIFTEFRESALDIVTTIESLGANLKPHIFIGQSKEKDKFDEDKYLEKIKKRRKSDQKQNTESELKDKVNRSSSEDAQLKGMNQKLQKEIIKKFNMGEYNILVATSIGEEGLDIGEVDLIVCYDSTSSPIKNIQRMGRTGRKRDGKVLLLFSSNEESKFEKAMGGYEYIQQHIMKKDVINLANRNRIIPSSFDPIAELKFIEIPKENLQIKAEEDEDEIIKIATNYMISSLGKKSKSRKSKKNEKQFFMPDGIETGFRSANKLVKKIVENNLPKSRERDILDKIVSSESEDDVFTDNNIRASSRNESLFGEDDKPFAKDPNSIQQKQSVTLIEHFSKKGIDRTFANDTNAVEELKEPQISMKNISRPPVSDYKKNQNKSSRTLGLKRRRCKSNIIDQLKFRQSKRELNDIDHIDINESEEQTNQAKVSTQAQINPESGTKDEDAKGSNVEIKVSEKDTPNNSMDANTDEDDVFDDGLDDLLISFDKNRSVSFSDENASTHNNTPKDISSNSDEIYVPSEDSNEGLLSEKELTELYTLYFTTIDPADYVSFYDPKVPSNFGDTQASTTRVGYGKTTKHISNCTKYINRLSPTEASNINKIHLNESKKLDLSVNNCIKYIDKIVN